MIFKENLQLNRYNWANKTLKNLIKDDNKVVSLFDIGSRDEILKKYCEHPQIKYTGFDLDPLSNNTRKWDIEQPFPYTDPKADIITFLEVVEHLNNPWMSFKNLSNTLKPRGYLLLTTPNPTWSNSRVNLLFKGQLSCFTQGDLDNNHHVFTPWPHILEKLLNDNGFKIIEYVTLDGNTNIFDKSLSPTKFPIQLGYRLIKKAIEIIDPRSRGMSYAILAQKL